MELIDNPVTRDLNEVYREMERLGLVENLAPGWLVHPVDATSRSAPTSRSAGSSSER